MKKLIFVLIAALSVTLSGCSWFDSPSSEDTAQKETARKQEPYWIRSEYHKAVVTATTNGAVHARHRVWFRIEGRERDSFEDNVDCWDDLKAGDSILVEEVFSSVIHYYKINKTDD